MGAYFKIVECADSGIIILKMSNLFEINLFFLG